MQRVTAGWGFCPDAWSQFSTRGPHERLPSAAPVSSPILGLDEPEERRAAGRWRLGATDARLGTGAGRTAQDVPRHAADMVDRRRGPAGARLGAPGHRRWHRAAHHRGDSALACGHGAVWDGADALRPEQTTTTTGECSTGSADAPA